MVFVIILMPFTAVAAAEGSNIDVSSNEKETYNDNLAEIYENTDISIATSTGNTENVLMEYDDILDLSSLFRNYVIMDIRNEYVTSYSVKNGKCSQKLDKNIVSLYKDKNNSLIATGIGKAYVDIVDSKETSLYKKGTARSLKTLEITVDPANLTMVYAAGQSNMEGTCFDFDSHSEDSVVCSRGSIYSAYAPTTASRANVYTGLSNSKSSIGCEDEFVPGNLSSVENVESVSGKDLIYPVYALSSDGKGKTGPDSGFAYEWNRLTKDKVFIVNAAYCAQPMSSWKSDTQQFKEENQML